ncbi:unnamed protein product [Paramecium octaurelia]|uniref:Uncharacterized protein n=1 Tax=Paramecium octaurelia TaxID=43137 RepID=A0A8S1UC06_PAROT|nr:unnamed protein product [Paramecium octaurelia]
MLEQCVNNGRKKSRQMEIRCCWQSSLQSLKQLQRTILLSIRSYCTIFKRWGKYQQKLLIIVIICQHIQIKQRKYFKG